MSAQDFAAHFAAFPNIANRARVVRFTDGGCWEWPTVGYARLYVQGRTVGLHRLSLGIALGRDLDAAEDACHRCDNPPCCNPAHLFAGSRRDNVRDAVAKGRAVAPPRMSGAANVNASLADSEVVAALYLAASGISDSEVARICGVTRAAVAGWRKGRTRRQARTAFLAEIGGVA